MSLQQENFKKIADAIREKTGETNLIKPSAFADKISDVYDEGYTNGRNAMISRSLNSIDDESLTKVGNFAFAGMGITSVNLPNVYDVGKYGFRGCTRLTEVDLPNLTRLGGIGEQTFGYCEKVTRYNLPKLKTDSTQSTYAELFRTFEGNSALKRLELKNDITISKLCFYKCSKLKALILGANASLKSTDAFNDTPIKNGGGYIYVPDDKVSTYKTATNWVVFASQIKSYSELPICFYINSTMYQVPLPLGSTWNDFLVSEHNNDRTFAIRGTDNITVLRRYNGAYYAVHLNGREVRITDVIQSEQKYTAYGT